jgi:Tol biopolymer transport system component
MTATGAISVKVAALMEGVLKAMLLAKLKTAVTLLLVLGMVAFGGILLTHDGKAGPQARAEQPKQRAARKDEQRAKTASRPKGGRLFFVRVKGVGQSALETVSPDGKGESPLPDKHKPIQPGFHAVSPDGQKLAYGFGEGNSDKEEIFLKTMGDEKPGESLKVQGSNWCWSPDGRSLAITTLQDNALSHEIFDLKTRKTRPLQLPEVKAQKDIEGPVGHAITDWSKDGRWFLTTAYRGDLQTDLYRVKSDGSDAKRIGQGMCGQFSPDGKKILYLGWKDGETPDKGRLFVADADGGNSQQVSQESNGKFQGGFCWSPDGKKIAYVWQRDRDGESQEWETFLMVMHADGKNAKVVLTDKQTGRYYYVAFLHPQWR